MENPEWVNKILELKREAKEKKLEEKHKDDK